MGVFEMILLLILFVVLIHYDAFVYYLNHWFGKEYAVSEQASDVESINKYNLFNFLKRRLYDSSVKPDQANIEPESLPVYDASEFDIDRIYAESNGFREPFIVRGLIKDHRCCREWDLDYFEKYYGDLEIPTLKDGTEILDSKNTFHTVKNTEVLSLRELIKRMKNGEKSYINNSSMLFYKHPEILEDFEYEKLEKLFESKQRIKSRVKHLFFGPKDTGSALHCAFVCNMFFNIYGKKKWVFIHPKYSRQLKAVPSIDGVFAISPLDAFDEDSSNPFLRIPRYENTLEPGDMLFVAGWWWHAVKNVTDYTIAVANRTSMPMKIISNNKLFSSIFFSHPGIIFKRFLWPYFVSNNEEELCKNSNKAIEENHIQNITSNYDS